MATVEEREILRAELQRAINEKEPGIKVFDWTFGNEETGDVRWAAYFGRLCVGG